MPVELTVENVDHLIERSKAGESLKDIAHSVGYCDRTIMEAFHRRGFRYSEWARGRRAQLAPLLHARHLAGESILAISQSTGISRRALNEWFEQCGLDWRGTSEAQRNRMSKLTADERKANAAAANFVARVREIGLGERIKRAESRSRRVGYYEREVVEEMRRRGFECDHQHPIGVYNVDAFLHESRVAVEIYRSHPGRELMARLHKRTEYLLNAGVNQITVQRTYPKGGFDLAAVCDQLVAFADFCRRNKSAIGHHGVIRGNGKVAATSSHQSGDRPLVTGFGAPQEAASDLCAG